MEIYTTGKVAKICKVAARTAIKWFDSGRLKGYRIPGSLDRRVPRDSLVRFMIANGMPLELIDAVRPRLLFVTGCSSTSQLVSAIKFDEETSSVCVVSNGFEAARAIAGTPPPIVMIDFTIGRSEAIQLARSIRAALATESPDTRYIAIACEDEVAHDSLSAPGLFDEVHTWPVDFVGLVQAHLGGGES